MRRVLWGLLLLAFGAVSLMISPRSEAAQTISIFIYRAQVEGVMYDGKVYAPVSSLLKAFGYEWSASGTTLQLSKGTRGGPEVRIQKPVLFVITPDGKTLNTAAIQQRNATWVQVKPLAEALGGSFILTSSAGIAQVVFGTTDLSQRTIDRVVKTSTRVTSSGPAPVAYDGSPTTATPSGAPSGSPSAAPSGSPEAEEKEAIEVSKLDFSNPVIPGSKVPAELRGTATIKNTSDQRVTNVKFTVELKDLGGNPVAALPTKYISAMEPGETSSQDFLWYNYYNQNINPKVKVEHDPLPKKKKKEDKEDKSGDTKSGETPASSSGGKTTPSPAPSGAPSGAPGGAPSGAATPH